MNHAGRFGKTKMPGSARNLSAPRVAGSSSCPSASELKRVYIALHAHLLQHIELMDTDFLTDLQSWLQHVAGQEGVDVGDHAAWEGWLHS